MASASAGRRGRRWDRIRAETRLLHQSQRRSCCLCGQTIDYTLRYPDKRSWSLQHVKDWLNHPELREDPSNFDAAHLDCNSSDGARTQGTWSGLGSTSEDW